MSNIKTDVVTEEMLSQMELKYYGGGKKVKVGDRIYYGLTNTYANVYGIPPTEHDPTRLTLSMTMFVMDEVTGFLYQLYKLKEFGKNESK